MSRKIGLKRIYDSPDPADGFRVLVDRLWARGVTREAANIDLWAKELTPSNELRKWFHQATSRQPEFQQRYRSELDSHTAASASVMSKLREQATITLVTATKDLVGGHAAILQAFLSEKL